MHMRKKHWTEPALAASGIFLEQPQNYTGNWKSVFPRVQPMELEVGCGKCMSTAAMALDNPGINYLAVDESRTILGVGCRSIAQAFGEKPTDNLRLTCFDVLRISDFLAPADRVERIHINFCNPWTQKSRHFKRRLTHTRQLMQYRTFLADGGEIRFKTDDASLFEATHDYLDECGFQIVYETNDLHASGYAPNYVSEHERMYSGQGVPIHFLIAQKGLL